MKRSIIVIGLLSILFNYTVSGQTIGWCNLQFPETVEVYNYETIEIFARVYAEGITEGEGQGANIEAWIGVSTEDTNPETWDTWIPAYYHMDYGNDDEYSAVIGPLTSGTYYYASRFIYEGEDYVYGGFSSTGGNFWDGVDNVSGIATITDIQGSTCETPFIINLPAESPVSLSDQTSCNMVNMYNPACLESYGSGQDVLYRLDITEPVIISIELDPIETARTGIALYNGCPDVGDCITYYYDNTANVRELDAVLQPGTYFLIIDRFIVVSDCIESFNLNIGVETEACLVPLNLMADEIIGGQISLSWTPGFDETEWQILYGEAGFDTDTEGTLLDEIIDNPFDMPTLTVNKDYEIYIRSVCQGEEFSEWSEPLLINTCTSVADFPWIESFEDDSEFINCWTQIFVTGDQEWIFDTGAGGGGNISTALMGDMNARFYKHSAELLITKLVSPELNILDLDQAVMTFWMGQELWDEDQNELKVFYRKDQSSEWGELAHYIEDINQWTKIMLNLPEKTNDYQIAFEGIHNFGRANVIDDVSVRDYADLPEINIVDIYESVSDITVGIGISEEEAINLLAEYIVINDTEDYEYFTELEWTIDSFDGMTEGNYVATASFILPPGVLQTDPETLLEVQATITVDSGVKITENKQNQFNIYPNPGNGVFNIDCSGVSGNISYKIYDSKGRILKSEILNANNTEISTNLKSGIYYIMFEHNNNNTNTIKKLIVE
jgi:hypothetical protein